MKLWCTGPCGQPLHESELCHHRHPVCEGCCPVEHPVDLLASVDEAVSRADAARSA